MSASTVRYSTRKPTAQTKAIDRRDHPLPAQLQQRRRAPAGTPRTGTATGSRWPQQLQRVGEPEQGRAAEQAGGSPVAEDHDGQADVAAVRGLPLPVGRARDDRQERPAEAGQATADRHRQVAQPDHLDAEALGRGRRLTRGPQPEAERGPPQHERRERHQQQRHDGRPGQLGQHPAQHPGGVREHRDLLRRTATRAGRTWAPRRPPRRPARARSATRSGPSCGGDLETPPPGWPLKKISDRYWVAPSARMLMATPLITWSTLNRTVATAWIRPPRQPPSDAEQDAGPGPELPGAVRAEPGAEDHHPLDTDVDDADTFGPEAGQPGEQQRDRQPQRRRDGARRGELVGAGDHPHDRQQHEQARPRPGSAGRWWSRGSCGAPGPGARRGRPPVS